MCRAVGQRLGRLLKTFIVQRRGVSYSGERRGGGRGAKSAVRADSKATDRVEDVLKLSREDVEE